MRHGETSEKLSTNIEVTKLGVIYYHLRYLFFLETLYLGLWFGFVNLNSNELWSTRYCFLTLTLSRIMKYLENSIKFN